MTRDRPRTRSGAAAGGASRAPGRVGDSPSPTSSDPANPVGAPSTGGDHTTSSSPRLSGAPGTFQVAGQQPRKYVDIEDDETGEYPWLAIRTENPDWDRLLRSCDYLTRDEFASVIIDQIVTLETLRAAGPFVTMQFARYAVQRDVFDSNIPLPENFAIYAPREDHGAHSSRQAPASSSATVPPAVIGGVLKALEKHVYSGDEAQVPFRVWRDKLLEVKHVYSLSDSDIRLILPLTLAGQASEFVKRHPRTKFIEILDAMSKEFRVELTSRLALFRLRGANFQHYLRDDLPRVEAFDRLTAQISADAASAGPDHNNQWSVATYVLGAMSDGGYHTEMARSFMHLSGNELLQSVRNFLSAQDKEAPRGSSSLLFQRAPGGPARRLGQSGQSEVRRYGSSAGRGGAPSATNQARRVRCFRCGRDGHIASQCAISADTNVNLVETEHWPSQSAAEDFVNDDEDSEHEHVPLIQSDNQAGADEAFLSFNVFVVSGKIPILLGNDVQERHHMNLIRRPRPPRLTGPGFAIPLYKMMSGHLAVDFLCMHQQDSDPSCLSEPNSLLYTIDELMTLHRRFGHTSARNIAKILRLNDEPLGHDELERLTTRIRDCPTCQWYAGRRTTYKASADVEVTFNHAISLDFLFIPNDREGSGSIKIMHLRCDGTGWSVAAQCDGATAQNIYSTIFTTWITYFGAPHRIRLDRERVLVSEDLERMLGNEGTVVDAVPVEAHWTLGSVERSHETVRKIYLKISGETERLSVNDRLAIVTRAMNCTAGPDGTIPSLLVFGTVPRMALRPEVAQHDSRNDQEYRIKAMLLARKEYEISVSRERLTRARRSRAPEYPRDSDAIVPGIGVLVRRDASYEYTGPYTCERLDGSHVTVVIPSTTGRPRKQVFSIHNTKVYRMGETIARFIYHTEQDEQETHLFDDARYRELQGLVNRGTFSPCRSPPAHANIVKARFDDRVKADGSYKARLVACGHRFADREAHLTSINSPVLTRCSFRTVVSLCCSMNKPLYYRDFSQAYIQSEYSLIRNVYLRLDDSTRDILTDITGQQWPLHAKLEKALYGLRESGTLWYHTISNHLKARGFVPTALDSCLMFHRPDEQFSGALGLLVDDTIFFGNQLCLNAERAATDTFESKGVQGIPFNFNGAQVSSCGGGGFRISIFDYVRKNLSRVKLPTDFDSFRSLRGRVAYVSNNGRPDLLYHVAKLSQVTHAQFDSAQAKTLLSVTKRLHLTNNAYSLIYRPLDIQKLKFRVYADASFASNRDYSSQIGYVVFLGDHTDTVHFLHAVSKKTRHAVYSVMGAELLALCAALDFAEALRADLLRTGVAVDIDLYTDSKQIYDAVAHGTTLDEKRMMIRLLMVRQSVDVLSIARLHHISGTQNVADALTKHRRHCPLWDQVMRNGTLSHHTNECIFFSKAPSSTDCS
ncbi:Retrovirus-related Pol polyprotein from transposon TNT 1-94 [Porphyridium purpureum]|uniref:Retrovirus-related Pol polyprotein from transposon TNT 1-94 n=1 Tax=Porphyridium purpureum TaxID=35688 RepID=A0A5J4YHN9_PORPP|nr:Retrovirus-related Pol polyprotein from transposon TNT 1-94 [Porphyridium purpureum]|eukprot:POR0942..scf289_17